MFKKTYFNCIFLIIKQISNIVFNILSTMLYADNKQNKHILIVNQTNLK